MAPGWQLAKWLRLLLKILVVISVIAFTCELATYHVFSLSSQGDKAIWIERVIVLLYWTARGYGFGWVVAIFFTVVVALFVAWTYRMNANLHQRRVRELQFSPGWAVAWYFVPVANFWKPHQVMSEICRASANPAGWRLDIPGGMASRWWTLVLIALLVDNFHIHFGPENALLNAKIEFWLTATAWVLDGIAASVSARLIGDVQWLQATSLDRALTVVFE